MSINDLQSRVYCRSLAKWILIKHLWQTYSYPRISFWPFYDSTQKKQKKKIKTKHSKSKAQEAAEKQAKQECSNHKSTHMFLVWQKDLLLSLCHFWKSHPVQPLKIMLAISHFINLFVSVASFVYWSKFRQHSPIPPNRKHCFI